MPITVSDSGGSSPKTLAPAGTHIARCVWLIDLGTQRWEWQGQPKAARKIRLTWELPDELHTFKEENGEEPFFVSQKYTASLGEKANLRKDLTAWRGRAFTEEELKKFDLQNILGKACMLTIVHEPDTKGIIRERIKSVTAMPKGMVCPPQIKPLIYYDLETMGDNDVYKALPQFLREDIAKSDEWGRGEAVGATAGHSNDTGSYDGSNSTPEIPDENW